MSAAPVIELIYAFRRSKIMFAAVDLGVFDRLQQGPQPATGFPNLNPATAARLLDALVSLGLLERDGDLYRNTPTAARYLARDSPDTLAGYISYSNSALYPMWADLEGALRDATPRWEPVLGFPPAQLFDHFFGTPERRRDFLSGMHGFGRLSSPDVVRAFDLSRYRRLVDLGGGTGHLAVEAARAWPNLSAAVFDLPAAIETARQFTNGEVDLIPGDFFADSLPPADIYSLGRILHDWSEDKCIRLLDKIHAALPAGGALLIAEILMDDDRRGPIEAHVQSLNMLVCTEGRERSAAEYQSLLESCGFTNIQGRRTGAPLDAVFALSV